MSLYEDCRVAPMGNEPEAGEPYWAGFDSPEAFFDHIEAERAKVQFHLEPRKRRIPALDPLGDPSAAELPVLARRQAVVRQVGVKLRLGTLRHARAGRGAPR